MTTTSLTLSAPNTRLANASRGRPLTGLATWFANRGVRTKLLFVIGVFAAVAVGSGVVATTGLTTAGTDITALAAKQQDELKPVRELQYLTSNGQLLVTRALIASDPATKQNWLSQLAANDANVTTMINAADSGMSHYGYWSQFKNAWAAYTQARDTKLIPAVKANDATTFQRVFQADVKPDIDTINATLTKPPTTPSPSSSRPRPSPARVRAPTAPCSSSCWPAVAWSPSR